MKTFLTAKKIGALAKQPVPVKSPIKQRFAPLENIAAELGLQNNLKISDWRRELDPKRVVEIQVVFRDQLKGQSYNTFYIFECLFQNMRPISLD